MITRHFYRFDEVRAALFYAIMRGRPLETAFWVQELVDSGLLKEAWTTLVEAWLWFSLATDPNWICDIRLGVDDLHLAAYRLCTNPKDNSLWATLVTQPHHDTLCRNLPPSLPSSGLERYFSLALFQRKGLAAIWAAHRLTADVQQLLPAESRIVPSVLGTCGLVDEAISLSAQILFVCSRTDQRPAVVLPAEIVVAVRRWTELVGRRTRRVFAVPLPCLYGLTERGRGVDTIAEFRRMDDRIREETTGFWPLALVPYRHEDAVEAFYAAFFPDDIPDEWSAEEAAKSHGPGLGSDSSSLQKIGSLWFQAESRFVWGSTSGRWQSRL